MEHTRLAERWSSKRSRLAGSTLSDSCKVDLENIKVTYKSLFFILATNVIIGTFGNLHGV